MTKGYSPISNILLIGIHIVGIWALVVLSYSWSLDQTQDFMTAVVGMQAAPAGAWLIQLAPQMLLVAAAISRMNGNHRAPTILILSALLVNALDAYTNIVTFREWWPTWSQALVAAGRSAEFVNATEPVGKLAAFLITWGEEGLSLALGSMLQLVADHMEAMGRRPPRFFRAGLVSAGGFDFRGVNKQAREQQQPQQQRPSGNGSQQQPRPTAHSQTAQRQQPRRARSQGGRY